MFLFTVLLKTLAAYATHAINSIIKSKLEQNAWMFPGILDLGGGILKVLFQSRGDYKNNVAGDSIQMLKTKEYLEKLDVSVDISSNSRISIEKYDLIHIFNLTRAKESYRFSQNAISQNKPYVLSTIYWNMIYYIKKDKNASSMYEWWAAQNELRREILKNASMLLPNSQIEMEVIKKDFMTDQKSFIIPNCSDSLFYKGRPENFISQYELKDFVLCVGRISPRKNQLSLIEALKGIDLKLVLIGPKSSEEYYGTCRMAAGDNVIFIDKMKHHELASAYAAAKVHVLPSWFETPGLSSLEAGLAGCNIVTTDKGSTKEYFKDMADYCNPSSIESISKAVIAAYNKPKGSILREYILENYTWEAAAKKTQEAYRCVLDKQ